MKKVTAILIGAGQRGSESYASYALRFPNEFQIVAVAEPRDERRAEFQKDHGIADDMCFKSWEDILQKPKMADCALICTQDQMHYAPTIQALEKGYHLLIEKPMSPNAKEIIAMGEMAKKYNRIMTVCHVLRYTPFYTKLKEIIDSGLIGDVVSIDQIENVAYWHQAHSFVRGNWRNSSETSPMILAKSCHDMDILLWLMGSKCKKVSSFGSLSHFTKENMPPNAPKRCTDGCEYRDECAYFAPRLYLEDEGVHIPVLRKVLSVDTSEKALLEALKTGPYGRCVYQCDNDVVDHQVVNLEFANHSTVAFTMCAFTFDGGRTIKIMGTKGQIKGNMEENEIEVVDFISKNVNKIHVATPANGHSGGDIGIMKDFIKQVQSDGNYKGKTSSETSVESHLIALAAEHSRVSGQTIELDEFMKVNK